MPAETSEALQKFLECVATQEFAGLEELFRDDVRLLTN
jgi:hypothetical protein